MTIVPIKLMTVFIFPLGLALVISVVALAISFTNWRRMGHGLLACALSGLWIAATPGFANWVNWRLEWRAPFVSSKSLPQSDAIILLGGTPIRRIMRALWLYREGKAPLIVIAGGNPPGQAAVVPEAQRVADILVDMGVPRSALVLETKSRNTRENALNTEAIFKEHSWRHGLLVTERIHMPRALATFQKVGVDVMPVPTEMHSVPPEIDSLTDFLPDARALVRTTLATKEAIGLGIYRLRGWA
jgi:uncharacterized SAM-binding protein YcdF (DUF218 family)